MGIQLNKMNCNKQTLPRQANIQAQMHRTVNHGHNNGTLPTIHSNSHTNPSLPFQANFHARTLPHQANFHAHQSRGANGSRKPTTIPSQANFHARSLPVQANTYAHQRRTLNSSIDTMA